MPLPTACQYKTDHSPNHPPFDTNHHKYRPITPVTAIRILTNRFRFATPSHTPLPLYTLVHSSVSNWHPSLSFLPTFDFHGPQEIRGPSYPRAPLSYNVSINGHDMTERESSATPNIFTADNSCSRGGDWWWWVLLA